MSRAAHFDALNIRLGYWLPNPRWISNFPKMSKLLLGVGPLYLVRELLSKLNETSWYVNISDGGHIENTGIYELLRRRCKFIIVAQSG